MAPGSIFHLISFESTILVSYLLSLQYFTSRSINQKYQKYYFTDYPSLPDLTLQISVKVLTTPLSRWVQVGVCLCMYSVACALSPTGLIPWFSKVEGNTYSTLLHHPFLFKGKTNASTRSSKKNFWRRCRGDLCQAKIYEVPTIIFSILGEASSETYAPRVYFPSYKFPIYYFSIFYFPIYKPKIPKIFTLRLPISIRSHFCK